MQISETLVINRPPDISSGYSGGLQSIRDTTGVSGGIHGNVNCVNYSFTIAGKDVSAFEWNNLSVLHNYADAGENCASYIQGNKFGTGPTWAGCAEACSLDENDKTGLITYEMDSWISGEDSGNRITLDLVVGDSKVMRNQKSIGKAEATAAIRIGKSTSSQIAKYKSGIILKDNIDTGIDTTSMSGEIAIKMNPNQIIMIGDTKISSSSISNPVNKLSITALVIASLALLIVLL